jgi:transcriptional regulator with XRE-family HTH domain
MRYYVYTLAHPDGTVFYVGKGCGNRVAHHEQEALRGHNCPKCEVIRSIWRAGGKVQRAIVFETEDERAALDHEAALIRYYGRTQLVNRTSGGHGRLATYLPVCTIPVLASMAELVNDLFRTHRRPDGREYTASEVARALDGQLDPSYLTKMRKGKIENPTKHTLLLLCQFFQVPANYFFPELTPPADENQGEGDPIAIAARSAKVSPTVKQKLEALLRALQEEE